MGIMLLVLIVGLTIDYFTSQFAKINDLEQRIKGVETKIDYMGKIHELDKRVLILENKKKASTDPRIAIVIVLVLLLLLYLKSIGFFGS